MRYTYAQAREDFWILAKKSFGQNFLVNEGILEKIADAAIVQGRNIVEVGPGYGALTEYLLERSPSRLDLVELDKDRISILDIFKWVDK